MTKHKQQASAKTGMLPGSMVYIGENSPVPTKAIIHIYNNQSYQRIEGFDLDAIHLALAADMHVWVDITGLAAIEKINELCMAFSIHPLIAEDIVNTRQRPKLEVFEHYLFVVFKLLGPPAGRLTYSSEQFSMLVRKNLLLTFRETENYSLNSLYQRLSAELSMVRVQGSDYLTYLVMDNIIDNYFNFVEQSTHALEEMEDLLIEDPEAVSLQAIYTIKRQTLILRKTISPLRDIIHLLLDDTNQFIDENYRLYYRDLHDHTIRLLESIDLHHHMTSGMLEIYLSTLNNRMNQTMKVLTQFASIFIPLTFIVGIYGMNFDYMPELKYHYGYPTVLIVMFVLVMGMLYYFKRKKIF
jgi:magnesium transporter